MSSNDIKKLIKAHYSLNPYAFSEAVQEISRKEISQGNTIDGNEIMLINRALFKSYFLREPKEKGFFRRNYFTICATLFIYSLTFPLIKEFIQGL